MAFYLLVLTLRPSTYFTVFYKTMEIIYRLLTSTAFAVKMEKVTNSKVFNNKTTKARTLL
jgi:hypothetical protein